MNRTLDIAAIVALAAASLIGSSAASGAGLTEVQARTIIAPWYSLFNVASRGDVKTIQEQVLTADYESCSGYCRANAGVAIRRSKLSGISPTPSPT